MFGSQAAAAANINPNKDVQVTPALSDGISSLSFSPRANVLIATSWDNNVYCWEVAANGQTTAKASTSHQQPALCSAWNADGTAVFSGSCDKTVKMWNLATNQSQQVAQHDGPVRHCAYIPDTNMLVTGRSVCECMIALWIDTEPHMKGNPCSKCSKCILPAAARSSQDVLHPLQSGSLARLSFTDHRSPNFLGASMGLLPCRWQSHQVRCFAAQRMQLCPSSTLHRCLDHLDLSKDVPYQGSSCIQQQLHAVPCSTPVGCAQAVCDAGCRCLLQAAGTKPSSTGTSGHQTPYSATSCQSAAMLWMSSTRCWWWALPTAICWCSI
jgi:hypothetical protein